MAAVEIPNPWSDVRRLDCVDATGRRGFVLRLARDPARNASRLSLHVCDGGQVLSYDDDALPLATRRSRDDGTAVCGIDGAPWLEIVRHGETGAPVVVDCGVAAHPLARPPPGCGPRPLRLQARFEPDRTLAGSAPETVAAHGRVRAALSGPGGAPPLRLRGRGQWSESHERGVVPLPVVDVSLRGPRLSLVIRTTPSGLRALLWRDGRSVGVRAVRLGEPGPGRAIALTLEGDGGIEGSIDPTVAFAVAGHAGALVKGRIGGLQVTGVTGDWHETGPPG